MYDTSTGRWLSDDPISFRAGDANLYRYVGNSPTNATDPSGLDAGTSIEIGQTWPRGYSLPQPIKNTIMNAVGAGFAWWYQPLPNYSPIGNTLLGSAAFLDGDGREALLDALRFREAAHIFADNLISEKYPNPPNSETLRTWILEVANHYYWQMMLTIRHGPEMAGLFGDWHETGWVGENPVDLDRILDNHNNAMARQAAADLRKDFLDSVAASPRQSETEVWEQKKSYYDQKVREHIENLIADAVEKYRDDIKKGVFQNSGGKAIISANDPFITQNLGVPKTTPPGKGRPGWPPSR